MISTKTKSTARLVATAISLTLMVPTAAAKPAPEDATESAPQEPASDQASPQQALEAGDLTTARDAAVAAREANPDDPEAWKTEAEVHEARGDYAAAIAAWNGYLEALPEDAIDARKDAVASLERLREASRGTVADEPKSTHREAFDAERSPPPPKVSPPPEVDPADAAPRDRIVRKWYFWVTIAAIAASAGAITGIAIKAARTEQDDALDAGAMGSSAIRTSPAVIRF